MWKKEEEEEEEEEKKKEEEIICNRPMTASFRGERRRIEHKGEKETEGGRHNHNVLQSQS